MKQFSIASALLCSLLAANALGQSSYPMLMSLNPIAAQTGQTSEHEVTVRYNVYGTYQILVSGTGVTGEVVVPEVKEPNATEKEAAEKEKAEKEKADKEKADKGDKEKEKTDKDKKEPAKTPEAPKKPTQDKIKIRFKVAADATPGVRDFRMATPQGVTTLGQLVVVRDPVVVEKGDNDALKNAQKVTLPATVCGCIEKAEDVDQYQFHVEAGKTFTFHVESARCQDRIHDLQAHADPIILLKNSSGTVLASSDNFFYGDPLLSFNFPLTGDYILEIRDVRYQGNAFWFYSIEINDRPFITNVFPLAVAPGTATKLNLVGFNLPADPTSLVTLAADVPEGPLWMTLPLTGPATNPAPLLVSRLPLATEQPTENNSPAQAQTISVPAGVNGTIELPADIDCFAFEAKKGERFNFEIIARRVQSALDANVRILNDKSVSLVENDDLANGRSRSKDSLIEFWAAPADGKYFVEVSDLNLQGGPPFVYLLKVTRTEPEFVLEVDTDKTVLAPGLAGAIYVRIYRKNGFTGEVQLAIDGLPPGVTATCGKVLESGTDGCIVLQAAKDAKLAMANVQISGKGKFAPPEGESRELTAIALPLQETYMPGGGRGHWPVEMHTVSVSEPMDITSVKVSPTEINLKPGESAKIDITLERAEGFDKNITLDCIYRHLGSVFGNTLPPGVTIDDKASKTLLTGKVLQGQIVLKAAADAKPVERQQIAVAAHVAINFVMKMSYYGEPVFVTVAAGEKPAETKK
jgi:hypothetical protein